MSDSVKPIIIYGAGGQGREIEQLIKDINNVEPTWNVLGFVDDSRKKGETVGRLPVLGTLYDCDSYFQNGTYVITAIGDSAIRKTAVENIKAFHPLVQFATVIHPSARVADDVMVGQGCVIGAFSLLSTNVVVEDHVLVNYGCTIGHDAKLSMFSTVLPGANVSGNVTIEVGASIGSGAQILPGKRIGQYTIVGAGAVVNKDMPDRCTAVGVPAKPIKFHE